jgi:zeaxanthin glucosyltransferase
LYPALALARRLKNRGHVVTFFNRSITQSLIMSEGLSFSELSDKHVMNTEYLQPGNRHVGPNSVNILNRHALLVIHTLRSALELCAIEGLLVDQASLAGGSIAELLQIPFVNVSFSPPMYTDDSVPPFVYDWVPRKAEKDRRRNHRANQLFNRLLEPTLSLVNEARCNWGLTPFSQLNEAVSPLGIVTQLPKCLDFPREDSSKIIHAGPFVDDQRANVRGFPWHEVNKDKPVIYASLGTVRNGDVKPYQVIAKACSGLNVQLIISLGGMELTPDKLIDLPGRPIVVHYAPQLEIMKVASVVITHGGLNTTLEAIRCGLPMVVIPMTDDQPGVAARISYCGGGLSIPIRKLSSSRLESAVREVLTQPRFRTAAKTLQEKVLNADGLGIATDWITNAFER